MQFTTFTLSALSIGSALATTVHVVKVGNANGNLAYSPNKVIAAVGDMVQFQYAPANHTVTQSTFDQPCQPIALHSNVTGVYSGFMPVAATATEIPTYTIMINNTTPMWLYCSQAKHCQKGMTMVINENTAKNATRSLENFQALAADATVNLAGNAVSNGTSGEIAASATGTDSTTSTASSTSGAASSTATGAATAMKPSDALTLGGVLALGMALIL